jgi:hypothetical protein
MRNEEEAKLFFTVRRAKQAYLTGKVWEMLPCEFFFGIHLRVIITEFVRLSRGREEGTRPLGKRVIGNHDLLSSFGFLFIMV